MPVKVIFFAKRKAGLTPQQFRAHYESSHVKLAQKYIGHLLVGYRRNYPQFATLNPTNVPAGSQPAPHDIGYDCITELWFKDEAALEEVSRIFNDPVLRPILVADEEKFLQRDATVMIVSEEVDTGTQMTTQQPNIDPPMKDSMRAPWIAGDFGALAREIGVPGAERFVARMGLEPGARVLDIACGTGNVTIPLARRGAMVTGLDMTPHLLEEARAHATREGLHIRFDEGFAEALPYPDGSFDVVVSMFGIMFSPLPETVAAEMARVLRPGGRLALANWTPTGFGGKVTALGGRYLPPPPRGTISPFLWGEEATVRDRLKPGFDAVETRAVAVTWELQRSAADSAEFFAQNSGPIQVALGRLDAPTQAAFLQDLERLWIDNNLATDGESHTLISNEYLEALAVRR